MEDLTQLNNTELQQLLQNVVAEQDRRRELAQIPELIKEQAGRFAGLGGDKQELIDKINEPAEVEVVEFERENPEETTIPV